jgi:hypothetical protein
MRGVWWSVVYSVPLWAVIGVLVWLGLRWA